MAATYNGQEQCRGPLRRLSRQTGNTIRTVCVRMTDGYWPISYATTRDYVAQDTQACQARMPRDQQVDLYFYDNPGPGART